MSLIVTSLIAGFLTILSPCILPLLPVILTGVSAEEDKSKRIPLLIIGSLLASIYIFTLLLKSTSVLLGVPNAFWLVVSGLLIMIIGLAFLFPDLWEKLSTRFNLQNTSSKITRSAIQTKGSWKYVLMGVALGPIFTSCSPTYGIIVATILPASLGLGMLYLLFYVVGLGISLLAIVIGGSKLVNKLSIISDPRGWFKRSLGLVLLIIGLTIATGWVKHAETWLVERGWLGTTKIEQMISPKND